jgi:ABC-type Na+ efflux pump permease subunit
MSVIHDEEYRVGAVLHATSLRPGEYIWGKFLAVLSAATAVLAIHVGAMILLNHGTPAGDSAEFRGPLHLASSRELRGRRRSSMSRYT